LPCATADLSSKIHAAETNSRQNALPCLSCQTDPHSMDPPSLAEVVRAVKFGLPLSWSTATSKWWSVVRGERMNQSESGWKEVPASRQDEQANLI
jgi:hypothetical protein